MNFNSHLAWRYAVKKFDSNRKVSETTINSILEAGNLAPTSYGLQPFQFVVVEDRKIREDLVASSYAQRQVADSSHLIIVAIRTDVDETFIQNFVTLNETERGLPGGSMKGYGDMMIGSIGGMKPEDKRIWAAKQAYIALGFMLASCAVHEVDSCPMEGFKPADYNEKLGLATRNLHAQVLLPVGYRAEDDAYQSHKKVRRPLQDHVVRM